MNPLRQLVETLGYNLERRDKQVVAAEHLRRILEQRDIDCVLDVGAHKGGFGRALRRGGYRGAIASFEPQADTCSVLEQAAAHEPPWRVFRMALGDQAGRLPLRRHQRSDISSLLPLNRFGEQAFGAGEGALEEVEVRRGDQVWDEAVGAGARVFLKCDAQGYDLHVLEGFGARLERIAGIQVEAAFVPIYDGMPPWGELVRFLEARGFCVSGFYPVSRSADLKIIEADMMFVR